MMLVKHGLPSRDIFRRIPKADFYIGAADQRDSMIRKNEAIQFRSWAREEFHCKDTARD
jgi:hypothetical protein